MHPDNCPGGRKAKSAREKRTRKLYEIVLHSPEGQRSVFTAAHNIEDAIDSTFPVLDLDHWKVTSVRMRSDAP